ncbi:MAG: SOS response-associated peptidase family protein [Gammaproteobacteria bacterium]
MPKALTLTESYNVAPIQAVLLARNAEDGGRELAALHWGLIPAWSKEPKTPYSTINARQGLASAIHQLEAFAVLGRNPNGAHRDGPPQPSTLKDVSI